MKKDTARQWVNVLALVATLVVNGLANALPLNGQTTGEMKQLQVSLMILKVPIPDRAL